jgi:TPR repeat protein
MQMSYENKIYNPAAQPKDWLIDHFVVRTNVFEKIFKDIRTSDMKYPEQHYLIQGQRGMGKTTLLLRLKYEIENTPELNAWLVPVFFNEESYDLTTLSSLWEKLFKYLDDLWGTGGAYYKKTDDFVGKSDYEKRCYEWLQEILKTGNKKLVIFFDNFGELFLNNLKDKEQHRLREILMTNADIRIVGASAIVLTDLHDYSKPFYEFFKIMPLEGLNKDETFNLISKLQEKSTDKIDLAKSKAKIDTLAILTGGVIRTIMLVYEVILADQDGSALKDLETILDRITPLYKHRMEDLPIQQRRIVDVIAKKWDAISAKEISGNIRENGAQVSTKVISAQLQQLEKNNIIEKKQTNTKNHLYQMKERFFNIWYLMRHGDRNDKCKVVWLTKFLETWYADANEMKSFVSNHIKHLKSGKYYPESAILILDALRNSSIIDAENRIKLLEETFNIVNEEQRKLLPSINSEKQRQAFQLYKENKISESIYTLLNIENRGEYANLLLALCYLNNDEIDKASEIIDQIKDNSILKSLILGQLNLKLKNYNESLKWFLELYNTEGLEADRSLLLEKIGFLYEKLDDFDSAIKYYREAVSLGNIDVYDDLITISMEFKKFDKAENYYIEAIKNGRDDLKKELINFLIHFKNDIDKIEVLLNNAIKDNDNDSDYYYLKGINAYHQDNIEGAKEAFNYADKLMAKHINKNSVYTVIGKVVLADIYTQEINLKKALKQIEGLGIESLGNTGLIVKSIILIWNGNYKEGIDIVNYYVNGLNNNEYFHLEHFQNLVLLLLAKQQYHFVYLLFSNEKLNLKEKIKPIYYALMFYMQKEYPNEYLKMGDELKQPVEDILKQIEVMAVEYK